MALKEQANCRDLVKADKKLRQKERRKQKSIEAGYHRRKPNCVFDFINEKLSSSHSGSNHNPSCSKPVISKDSKELKTTLKAATIKSLNTQSYKVAEDIRRAEHSLQHLRTALARNASRDRLMASQLKLKVMQQENVIKELKSQEKAIHIEQNLRKNRKELAEF